MKGAKALAALLWAVLMVAPPSLAEQVLTVISEGVVESVYGSPPPSWREVTQEALKEAVVEVGRRILLEEGGDEEGMEEALEGHCIPFVIGYRVLGRREGPEGRMVRLEVRVDKKALREYLRKVGILRERIQVVYLTISGLRSYDQFQRVDQALKGGEDVERSVLWEASRGEFTWRVEMGERGDLGIILGALPVRIIRREGDKVEGQWIPQGGDEG